MTIAGAAAASLPSAPQQLVAAVAAWALVTLIFSSNLLPIGEVFGVPFRMMLYVITLAATAWLMLFNQGPGRPGSAAFYAAMLGLILLAALNGLLNETSLDRFVIDDLRAYIITFTIPMLALMNVEMRTVSPRGILRAFVWGTLIYAALKSLFFWTLVLFPKLAVLVLLIFLNDSRASIVFGMVAPGISRIQTGLDFSVIISVVILLLDRKGAIFRRGRTIGVAILAFCVMVTFSRALVALLIIALIGFLIFQATRRVRIIGGTLLGAMLALALVFGASALQNRLETGQKGDLTRIPQAEGLLDLWEIRPLLGSGLGAYNPVVTRDKEAPYNYELQLHSLASKLGLVGVGVFIALAVMAFIPTVGGMPAGLMAWPVGIFLAFLGAAATNPYMFSSAAANVYIALFIGFRAFAKSPRDLLMTRAEG